MEASFSDWHQLRAIDEPLGHLRKGARQVADLVEERGSIAGPVAAPTTAIAWRSAFEGTRQAAGK